MRIAINQPYFFPYVGYFELMASVDLFVFLDDVQFIRRGWVNRNRIKSKDRPFQYLTVPVQKHARETKINDMRVVPGWTRPHLAILQHTFGSKVMSHPLVELYPKLDSFESLNDMLQHSLTWTAARLGLPCKFARSIGISGAKSQDKLIDICRHFGADTYINLSGGRELYDADSFAENGIQLQFLDPTGYSNKMSILEIVLTEEPQIKSWLHAISSS